MTAATLKGTPVRTAVTTASTSWVINLPTGLAADDVVILVTTSNADHTVSTYPSGVQATKWFTEFDDGGQTGTSEYVRDNDGDPYGQLFAYTVPATPPATITVTMAAAVVGAAYAMALSGADTTTALTDYKPVNHSTASGLTVTTPSLTTTGPDEMILRVVLLSSTSALTAPAGAVGSIGNPGGSSPAFLLAAMPAQAAAGATGTADATYTGTVSYGSSATIGIKPAVVSSSNVTLTGLVSTLDLAAPIGTVAASSGSGGNVTLTGQTAALVLSAPVGAALLETNIADAGVPAGITLAAPAGTFSLSGAVVAPVWTVVPVTDFYHARGTVWSRAGDTDIAQGSITVPTAPTNLGYSSLTSTGFTFSFSAPASDGGAPVLDYSVILRQLATTIATSPNLAASPRTFAGLTQGTAYVASVRARNVAGLGAEATLAVTTPTTGSGVTNASMPYPVKSMRAYQMIYSSNASRIQSMQGTAVNVICLAFMAGSPPGVVGYTSLGSQSAFSAALIALRNTGCRVSLSYGGAGNSVDMSRAGIVNSVNSFSANICPVDSLDVDVESGGVPSASTLKLAADDLRAGARGPNFGYTMVPPGGPPVDTFLPIAVDLHNNGYLHAYGQQFYDSPVDDGAMKYRISQAINAGLPFSKWEMGVMNPPGGGATSSYWTNDTAIARINSAKAAFGNTMKGSYYWQYDRDPGVGGVGAGDGGPLWASRISAVI